MGAHKREGLRMAGSHQEVHAQRHKGPYDPEGPGDPEVAQRGPGIAPMPAYEAAHRDRAQAPSAETDVADQRPFADDYSQIDGHVSSCLALRLAEALHVEESR